MICEQQYKPENISWGQFIDLEIGTLSEPIKSALYSKSVTPVQINSPKKIENFSSITEENYDDIIINVFSSTAEENYNDINNEDKPFILPSTEIKKNIYNTCINISVISLMSYVLLVLL